MSSQPEHERTELARLLKEAREYLDLSQEDVAKSLGVPRSAISLLESGQRKVDAIELRKLAAVYRRPVAYFTGEDVVSSSLPETVQHLARQAAALSSQDQQELARFAEFLKARSIPEKE